MSSADPPLALAARYCLLGTPTHFYNDRERSDVRLVRRYLPRSRRHKPNLVESFIAKKASGLYSPRLTTGQTTVRSQLARAECDLTRRTIASLALLRRARGLRPRPPDRAG